MPLRRRPPMLRRDEALAMLTWDLTRSIDWLEAVLYRLPLDVMERIRRLRLPRLPRLPRLARLARLLALAMESVRLSPLPAKWPNRSRACAAWMPCGDDRGMVCTSFVADMLAFSSCSRDELLRRLAVSRRLLWMLSTEGMAGRFSMCCGTKIARAAGSREEWRGEEELSMCMSLGTSACTRVHTYQQPLV